MSRRDRYSLIVIAAIPLIAVALFWWSSIPPSDASLRRGFFAHHRDLDRLVQMMDLDDHMERIADDFTRGYQEENRLSVARWNEYRALFRNAHLGHGAEREENSCDTELIVWDFGLVTGGESREYVHCGTPTKQLLHTEPDCQAGKDRGTFSDEVWDIRYEKLADDWYFEEAQH